MVLLTVVLTVRTGVLLPVFPSVKNHLTVKLHHFKAVIWKDFPAKLSFPNVHTEHRTSS